MDRHSLMTRLNYFRKGLEAPNACGGKIITEAMERIKELESAIADHRVETVLMRNGGHPTDEALWAHLWPKKD